MRCMTPRRGWCEVARRVGRRGEHREHLIAQERATALLPLHYASVMWRARKSLLGNGTFLNRGVE